MIIQSPTSFEVFYKQFYRKAFLFTKSYVHDGPAAEDIAAESFIKLWEESRRNRIEHPEVFLLTILKNKAMDYLKHETVKEEVFRKLENAHQEELAMRISLLESCNPEEVFATEVRQILQDTLARFPEQTRLIFELSRFENQSNRAIAQRLGLTEKSIEYHITKVLRALRISLQDYLSLFGFFLFLK
ncbi:MAG: RNA polymerase sigma-70 factor [Tannerella sp.]|jgi:RNA polymerase sigma-70 factor (ECF subfamily)|nr:RNA polymerase sigma-70 factor [Tannerella sp.]